MSIEQDPTHIPDLLPSRFTDLHEYNKHLDGRYVLSDVVTHQIFGGYFRHGEIVLFADIYVTGIVHDTEDSAKIIYTYNDIDEGMVSDFDRLMSNGLFLPHDYLSGGGAQEGFLCAPGQDPVGDGLQALLALEVPIVQELELV